jgi:hypothetical protein
MNAKKAKEERGVGAQCDVSYCMEDARWSDGKLG